MPIGLNACAGQDSVCARPGCASTRSAAAARTRPARLEEIDQAGVDAEVLYPTPRLTQSVYATTDPEMHLALVQAYNDWLPDYASTT